MWHRSCRLVLLVYCKWKRQVILLRPSYLISLLFMHAWHHLIVVKVRNVNVNIKCVHCTKSRGKYINLSICHENRKLSCHKSKVKQIVRPHMLKHCLSLKPLSCISAIFLTHFVLKYLHALSWKRSRPSPSQRQLNAVFKKHYCRIQYHNGHAGITVFKCHTAAVRSQSGPWAVNFLLTTKDAK